MADLRMNPSNKGMPRFIIINQTTYSTPFSSKTEFDRSQTNCWYYDSSQNLVYIKAELHSAITVTVGWTVVYPPYVSPHPEEPTTTPTPEPTVQKPPNEIIMIAVTALALLIILILGRKRKSS